MPDDNKADPIKDLTEKVLGALESLNTRIDTIENGVNEQRSSLESLQTSVTTPKDDKEPAPDLAALDLESMSRKDFAMAIANMITSQINTDVVKPIQDQVGNLSTRTEEQSLKSEFEAVRKNNKDFDLYQEAMSEMIDKRPHLSVQELYVLAKAEHPEIAEEHENSDDNKNHQQSAEDSFGGLTPTSGSTTTNEGKDDAKTAAEKAWDDTMTGSSDVAA